MEGQAKASTAIKKVTKSTRNMNDAVLKARRELRKLKESQTASTKAAKKLAAANKKLAVSTKGMTNQFIKVNLASRGISKGIQLMTSAFAAGISAGISFEFTMAKISAISNVTGSRLLSLESVIRDIAKISPKTSTEVAAAALEMSKMGLAGQDLENSLEGVVNLSVALDENVSTVGQTLVNVKNVFQKDASEMTNIADKMFTTLGNSALNLEKFGTAFSFAGASARLAGVSFEQLSGMMGVLADNGIKASTIGTQLRQVFTRLDDPTSEVSKLIGENSIKNLGLAGTFEVLSEAINNSGDAKKLFGQRAIGVIDILTKNSEKMEELTQKTREMEKSTRDAADALGGTFQGQLKKVASAWENMFIAFGNSDFLKETLGSVAEDINNLSDENVGVIKKYFTLLGRFSPPGTVINAWKDYFGALDSEDIKKSTSALNDLRTSLAEIKKVGGEKDVDFDMTNPNGFLDFAGTAKQYRAIQDAKDKLAKSKSDEKTADAQKKVKNTIEARLNALRQEIDLHKQLATLGVGKELDTDDVKAKLESIALDAQKNGLVNLRIQALKGLVEIKKEAMLVDKESDEAIKKLSESITKEGEEWDKMADKFQKSTDDFNEFLEKMEEFQEKSSVNFAVNQLMADSLANSINTLGDAFAGLVFGENLKNLGQMFTSLAKQVVGDITKMLIKLALFKLAASAFDIPTAGFGIGGGASSFGTSVLQGLGGIAAPKASGFSGTVTQPTTFTVGEEGAEDVMIKPRSKAGKASGIGGGITVNIGGDVYGEEKFMEAVRTANENLERSTI